MEVPIYFYALIAVTAFLYASVGHGGASGYLALMALWGFLPETMRPTALVLNLIVALMAFVQYYRNGHFQWSLFWPFALLSIPFAYWGGSLQLPIYWYKKLLGGLLLITALRFWWHKAAYNEATAVPGKRIALTLGGGIGLLSGITGIGGGVLLSPVLLWNRWANPKQAAALSALFIWVNSLAGLIGAAKSGLHFTQDMYYFVGAALTGGALGARLGAGPFSKQTLQYLLAVVLCMAALKIIL